MFEPSELLKLAALLSVRAEEADAKAATHETQHETQLAAVERKRAESGRHFSAVCEYFHEKLKPKVRGPRKKPVENAEAKFEAFWQAYPKKRSKADAARAWAVMKCDPLSEKIMSALAVAKKCHDWTKEAGQFIPYPATWLRRAGWEDEHRGASVSPLPSKTGIDMPAKWKEYLASIDRPFIPYSRAMPHVKEDFIKWLAK